MMRSESVEAQRAAQARNSGGAISRAMLRAAAFDAVARRAARYFCYALLARCPAQTPPPALICASSVCGAPSQIVIFQAYAFSRFSARAPILRFHPARHSPILIAFQIAVAMIRSHRPEASFGFTDAICYYFQAARERARRDAQAPATLRGAARTSLQPATI